jgi:ketosteroid isomerase-like protein
MSEENVEIVRRGYEAFNRGDREAWLAILDPSVELVFPFFELEGQGPAHGHAGAEQVWDTWRTTFASASFEVDTIRDLGDTMLIALRVRGRGVGSEVPIEQRSWHVVTWREGRVIRLRAFLREAEALEAAGLSE